MRRGLIALLFLLGTACGDPRTNALRPVICEPHPTGHVEVSTLLDEHSHFADDTENWGWTINNLTSVTIDSSGNLYLADRYSNRIYKSTPAGVASTFAGIGWHAFENGFVHDDGSIAPDGTGGLHATAQFQQPSQIAIDSNDAVFVADKHNNRIRRIGKDGRVATYAGTGHWGCVDGPAAQAEFYNPEGVAVDGEGVVYVADTTNNRLRKITPDGMVATIAGNGDRAEVDGPALEASFIEPTQLMLDGQGNLFVISNRHVRKLDAAGLVTTVLGDLTRVRALAFDA